MGKKKSKKRKKKLNKPVYKSISELGKSRTGGQIALSGFTYQFLYSCYLILSDLDEDTIFTLEGLEDIDCFKCDVKSDRITHIQVKYSTKRQDASFLMDVLKNYLEAHLLDSTHEFKLVYDFDIAKGNLSKLVNNKLDDGSKKYWHGIIEKIKDNNPQWSWSGFSRDVFLSRITFEKQAKADLSLEIEKLLIEKYDITTSNIKLYANGIKVCCLNKMERRESIDKKDLNATIQDISDDIAKGFQNPAHGWINRVDFSISEAADEMSYYEGKKAIPQDIVLQLPVRRIDTEREVENSIKSNRVTVIKASSGQGKTTVALQVAFNLSNEYQIYQLTWCNDAKELDNIVKYFKSRVKLGEKPLIIIDNLDSQLSEWNRLAQLLQEDVTYSYKLLLTSREDDWYSYSGNLSNVKSLGTVNLSLNSQEAKDIFTQLEKRNLLHEIIVDWKNSWEKVADKRLLIEYVYLLTHGEMISERINQQISLISNTENGRIKCEILRIVCFADVCGIRIPVMKLIQNLKEPTSSDYGEILKSVENEFLISIDEKEKYIEGLHPVRSMHVVERLHEFYAINATVINVVKLTDLTYLSKLFSNLPKWITNREVIYDAIVKLLWNDIDLSVYIRALKGLLSGSIDLYFVENKEIFDDANDHGGLLLVSSELNPFVKFVGFDFEFKTLDEFKNIAPDNENIQYLCDLRDKANKFELENTDIYYFSKALFEFLINKDPLIDLASYALITYWLLNVNYEFNLSNQIALDKVWKNKDEYDENVLSDAMYACFCGSKEGYLSFVEDYLDNILHYLKQATNSLRVFVDKERRDIHIEYVLLPSSIGNGNEASVSRLKLICRTLPIYETYSSDVISPKLETLEGYKIPDDAHKKMPIRNIVLMFNQDFSTLWGSTIMSNYECDSMLGWINQWICLRKQIVDLFNKCEVVLCKLLEGKPISRYTSKFDNLRTEIKKKLVMEMRYPNQDRPFEEKVVIPGNFDKFRQEYFGNVQNFINQVVKFMSRDQAQSRLAIINLLTAKGALPGMQNFFKTVIDDQDLVIDGHDKLCEIECEKLDLLIMTCEYYVEHKPSKHFNKYSIKTWLHRKKEKLITDTRVALNELEKKFNVTFPVDYYHVGILKYFPIIANDLNIQNPEDLMSFLYLCTFVTLIDNDYTYLVIAVSSETNQVMPNGFRVMIKFLEKLKVAIEEDDENLMEEISLPFPEEISQKFLNCFEEKMKLIKLPTSPYEGIDRIFELIWSYSTSRDILVDKFDSGYLSGMLFEHKVKITNLLKKYEERIPIRDYKDIEQLCNDVYNGEVFGDAELNLWNNKLISWVGPEDNDLS